jgi:hypothetical protein
VTASFESWLEVQLQEAEADALVWDWERRALEMQVQVGLFLEAAKSEPMTPEVRQVLEALQFELEQLALILEEF